MSTKLVIDFERRAVGSPPGADGYYLHTKIDVAKTTPDELEPCIVFTSSTEIIARICTFSELSSIAATTAAFTTFTAPSLSAASVVDTDEIRITVAPILWSEIGYTVPTDYDITTVVSPTEVVVSSAFPAYATGITYNVIRSGSPVWGTDKTDGEVLRTYAGTPDAFYRIKEHYDLFADLDTANNMLDSLRAQAQSLVDEYNRDKYTGISEETFE